MIYSLRGEADRRRDYQLMEQPAAAEVILTGMPKGTMLRLGMCP